MGYKICFLSILSPFNHKSWSGIAFQLYAQMSKYHDVTWVNAADMSYWRRLVIRGRDLFYRLLRQKFTYHYHLYSIFLAKTVLKKIKQGNYDFIVLGAGESPLIAHLNIDVPIIYIADTTFNNMIDYYPWHSGLCKRSVRQGHAIERNAMQKAAHLLFSSHWAGNSAINDYGVDNKKVSVCQFGANLIKVPSKDTIYNKAHTSKCRLLFLSVQWIRKGGDIAYETFRELKKSGVDCSLTIIGCNPDLPGDPDLRIIPFLDKNNETEFDELYHILLDSDILLLPTRADCTPIVFSEAAAFGLPVITTDTGGVTSVIQEGINGFCLPYEASAKDYYTVIKNIWEDKEAFRNLVLASRTAYDNHLNWDTWAEHFNKILDTLPARQKNLTTIQSAGSTLQQVS